MTQQDHPPAHPAADLAADRAADAIVDLKPTAKLIFLADVAEGLSREHKAIPPKYLYDDEGARIFDRITETNDYYPTRTEAEIFRNHAAEMADAIGERALVVEPGAGSGEKAVTLLDALHDPVGVIPVDISMDYVERSAEILARRFPRMEVLPLCADFTDTLDVPVTKRTPSHRLVFFPGSTVGNFHPADRRNLLKNFANTAGPDGLALIGADLKKDRETLEAAYDDSEGVTRKFNLNLLDRMNRELDADFDPDRFRYVAEWDERDGAVHMYLESTTAQRVNIADEHFDFAEGERIHTESSYKFTPDQFAEEAAACGFTRDAIWTDANDRFSVVLLRRRA